MLPHQLPLYTCVVHVGGQMRLTGQFPPSLHPADSGAELRPSSCEVKQVSLSAEPCPNLVLRPQKCLWVFILLGVYSGSYKLETVSWLRLIEEGQSEGHDGRQPWIKQQYQEMQYDFPHCLKYV